MRSYLKCRSWKLKALDGWEPLVSLHLRQLFKSSCKSECSFSFKLKMMRMLFKILECRFSLWQFPCSCHSLTQYSNAFSFTWNPRQARRPSSTMPSFALMEGLVGYHTMTFLFQHLKVCKRTRIRKTFM